MNFKQLQPWLIGSAAGVGLLIAYRYASAQQSSSQQASDLASQASATQATLMAQEQGALLSQQLQTYYPFQTSPMGVGMAQLVPDTTGQGGASGTTPVVFIPPFAGSASSGVLAFAPGYKLTPLPSGNTTP